MSHIIRGRRKKKKRPEETSYLAFSIICCGILIYALYVSSAGKWVMENCIEPVFNNSVMQQESKQSGADATEQNKENQTQKTMSYNGFTMYAMQVGAYTAEDNALKAAEDIRNRGGAGYVVNDGSYRVLAFGYDNEGDANTVKEQLKSVANMESGIYAINVPSLEFKITGEDKNLSAVDGAFKTYLSSKDKVGELALKLDTNEITAQDALEEMNVIKDELIKVQNSIDKLAKSDEKLSGFNSLYNEIITQFNSLGGSDTIILSAGIKNIYMNMVCRYADYVKGIMSV